MKKYLVLFLAVLCISHTLQAVPVESDVVSLKAENTVNMKVAGLTLILSGLAQDFVPCNLVFYGTSITGTSGFPQTPKFSIGWTPTNYEDLTIGVTSPLAATGNSASFSFGNIQNSAYGKAPVIPAGTDIFLNVLFPDPSATINIQQIYITGYYLF